MYRFWDSITRPLLDITQPQSVVEIGVEKGRQTELLLSYLAQKQRTLHCIDTGEIPHAEWMTTYKDILNYHQGKSLDVLPTLDEYDAVLIDGDHNWYTVFHELQTIERAAQKHTRPFPLVLLHDVGWPYGRRDLYYDPLHIPEAFRHPYAVGGMLPGKHELSPLGYNADLNHALHEGGEHNGVLTAVEDFLKETTYTLTLETIAGINGLGIIIDRSVLETNQTLQRFMESLRSAPLRQQLEKTNECLIQAELEIISLQTHAQNLENEINRLQKGRIWRWMNRK